MSTVIDKVASYLFEVEVNREIHRDVWTTSEYFLKYEPSKPSAAERRNKEDELKQRVKKKIYDAVANDWKYLKKVNKFNISLYDDTELEDLLMVLYEADYYNDTMQVQEVNQGIRKSKNLNQTRSLSYDFENEYFHLINVANKVRADKDLIRTDMKEYYGEIGWELKQYRECFRLPKTRDIKDFTEKLQYLYVFADKAREETEYDYYNDIGFPLLIFFFRDYEIKEFIREFFYYCTLFFSDAGFSKFLENLVLIKDSLGENGGRENIKCFRKNKDIIQEFAALCYDDSNIRQSKCSVYAYKALIKEIESGKYKEANNEYKILDIKSEEINKNLMRYVYEGDEKEKMNRFRDKWDRSTEVYEEMNAHAFMCPTPNRIQGIKATYREIFIFPDIELDEEAKKIFGNGKMFGKTKHLLQGTYKLDNYCAEDIILLQAKMVRGRMREILGLDKFVRYAKLMIELEEIAQKIYDMKNQSENWLLRYIDDWMDIIKSICMSFGEPV